MSRTKTACVRNCSWNHSMQRHVTLQSFLWQLKYQKAGLSWNKFVFPTHWPLTFFAGSSFLTPWWYLRWVPYLFQSRSRMCPFQVLKSSVHLTHNFNFSCISKLLSSPSTDLTWAQIFAVRNGDRDWSVPDSSCNNFPPTYSAASKSSRTRAKGERRNKGAKSLTWPALWLGWYCPLHSKPWLFLSSVLLWVLWRHPCWGHLPEESSVSWMTTQDAPIWQVTHQSLSAGLSSSCEQTPWAGSFESNQSLAFIWHVHLDPWLTGWYPPLPLLKKVLFAVPSALSLYHWEQIHEERKYSGFRDLLSHYPILSVLLLTFLWVGEGRWCAVSSTTGSHLLWN